MKIILLTVGKTTSGYLSQGIEEYSRRIAHYADFSVRCLSDARNTRNMTQQQQRQAEGRLILAALEKSDYVVLLDEHGKMPTSVDFAQWLQRRMASGLKRLVLLVGGPYGFSEEVRQRANEQLSLSKMTFPHELVRLIFVEQLYRAFTILNHEPYHHE